MRTVFYSWQSDVSTTTINRYLIRDALQRAAGRLSVTCEVDEATRGVAGSPPLTETILDKIDKSGAFVGDLSLVISSESRKSCNPNVLIEYGYALARLGEKNLIPVMNQSYGSVNLLPFDLRHKAIRVIYDLSADADKDSIKTAGKKLEGLLLSELRLIFEDPKATLGLSDPELRIAQHILRS